MVLAGFLGWVAVRRGLAPLQAIRQGAAGVTANRLDYRLAVDAVPGELAELADAIHHTPKGGNIRVRIEAGADGTLLAVENTGEPIPQKHLSRIFDRFYRADPSRHRGGEGAGLGLAIARSIIRAHGGEICVRSGMDGVCFEIRMA